MHFKMKPVLGIIQLFVGNLFDMELFGVKKQAEIPTQALTIHYLVISETYTKIKSELDAKKREESSRQSCDAPNMICNYGFLPTFVQEYSFCLWMRMSECEHEADDH
eukprot:3172_1